MDESRLGRIGLFAGLTKRQRSRLVPRMREVKVDRGEHVVDEGELAYEFFVIEEGTAAVISGGKHLADLGPGDFLGEIGLVQHRDRTASVIATSAISAIVMAEKDFVEMARSYPTIAREIDSAIEERLARDRLFGLDR